ncbi:hypothetical protein LSH36_872g00012 [Paralvinella palmiformis]|uniref:TIR domain-containing protein n=1 Tax=Paralvinella palmiformis TaxID=53620 RepID=A0AAD9MTD9_9ANNE|nr:hypothetical protein LSH36_872g00012 [Paralvinella palmiformis]
MLYNKCTSELTKMNVWVLSVGLNRLGCFEANKDRIVEKGVLPLYLELVEKSCNEDERLIAAQGLWIFGYSDRCRNLIQNDAQMLSALHSLQQSSSSRDELRRAVAGALWIIEGRRSGVGAVPKSPKLPAGAGHIYISYHWTCVQFVGRLRDKLRSFGYKVFVDTENMGTCGLPLETVFEGLEKACVLIMCMSQKYKDSPCCRNGGQLKSNRPLRIQHALRLRRDILPLRLQQKYNPDGWLASVTNTRLIFDFSRDENLENVTMALIRELGPRGKSKSSLAAAAAAASVASVEQGEGMTTSAVYTSRSPSNQSVASGGQSVGIATDVVASRVIHWTESDVSHWLMDNGLTSAIDR